MDAKLAKYIQEQRDEFLARAKDLKFYYECEACEGEERERLFSEVMTFVEDVEDFFHHLAIG